MVQKKLHIALTTLNLSTMQFPKITQLPPYSHSLLSRKNMQDEDQNVHNVDNNFMNFKQKQKILQHLVQKNNIDETVYYSSMPTEKASVYNEERFKQQATQAISKTCKLDARSEKNIYALHPTMKTHITQLLCRLNQSLKELFPRKALKAVIVAGLRPYVRGEYTLYNFGLAVQIRIAENGKYLDTQSIPYEEIGRLVKLDIALTWGGPQYQSYVQFNSPISISEIRERLAIYNRIDF